MKIVFFHQKKQTIGGGLLQFCNLCNYLSKHTSHEVCYVDFYNATVAEMMKDTKIKYIDVEQFNVNGYEDAVFITPPNYIFYLLQKIHNLKKAKILLYDWHLYSSIYLRNQFKNPHVNLSAVYSYIDEKNGIVFMDDVTRISCKKILGILPQKRFIPVTKEVSPRRYSVLKRIHKDKICVGYLGRLDIDKIYSLINIADNLMEMDEELPIEFHIIGDGDSKNLIDLSQYAGKIKFIFTSYLIGNELYSYLKEHVDVLVAVGLSCLNGAELGLPCIIAPVGSKRFYSDQFIFLYEMTDYTLGYTYDMIPSLDYDFKPLKSIIHAAVEQKEYHGKMCYQYFLENHQISYSAAKCVEWASQTKLTVENLMDVPEIKEQWKSFCKFHKKTEKDYHAFCSETVNKNTIDYEKFQDYFYILCDWLRLKQHGINLEEYFSKNNYSSIAIYGMGQVGHLLCDELKTSDIEIKYGIDKNANAQYEGLTIISPEKISEKVDVIVVTPSFAFDEIKEMLSTKTESAIISVNDVLQGAKEQKFLSVHDHYEVVLKKLQKKARDRKIRVAFLVLYTYSFSSLPIYKLMREDDRYETSIIVIPDISRGIDHLRDNYKKTIQELREIDENVKEGYDIESDHYVDIKDDYDLIFFNNPYKHMIKSVHSIEHFLDSDVLTLYVNYGFFTLKYGREIVRTNFYNYLWKVFIDSNENLEDLKKEEIIRGKNGVVSGYLKMDSLAVANIEPKHRKRVLICPHHTVPNWTQGINLELSNFLKYAELILELPKKYPELDFIFRPHPFLFYNLVSNKMWSEEERDLYLDKINQIPNIVYDTDGDYFDTFANSDAMIHDCGSFTAEYLFTEKPCCYMLKNEFQIQNEFLPMGQECLKHYYKAYEKEDIYKFIKDVVIGEKDSLKAEREYFSREFLKFNYPKAAEFAYQYITDLLFNNRT